MGNEAERVAQILRRPPPHHQRLPHPPQPPLPPLPSRGTKINCNALCTTERSKKMYGITDENWLEYAKTYEYEIRHKYVKELCNSRNIVTMRVLLQFFLKHLEKLEQRMNINMFKVYKLTHQDAYEWIATFRHPEDAAILIAASGNNSRICIKGKILWHEGAERQPAAESYQYVAEICYERASNP